MLEKNKRERIIALVNKEVVPAIGCTEPMAVALCTAKAATTLGKRPERIEVRLSPNMLKNASGCGYSWNRYDRSAYRSFARCPHRKARV